MHVGAWQETFNVGELKGLLTGLYKGGGDTWSVGRRYNGPGDDLEDPDPRWMHYQALEQWIRSEHIAVCMDKDRAEPVSCSPVWKYEAAMTAHPKRCREINVTCTLYYTEYSSDPGELAASPPRSGHRRLMYRLYYSKSGTLTGGAWEPVREGMNDPNPDFLWAPITDRGQYATCPNLSGERVDEIFGD